LTSHIFRRKLHCVLRGIVDSQNKTGMAYMKIAQLDLISAVVLVAVAALLTQPVYADGVRSEIDAANAQFSALAAKGDGAGLAALYAADGQVLPAGSDPVKGPQAIQKFWQGALDSGIAEVGLKTIEIFGHGPTATEVGQYELRDKAGTVLDHGKYIVVWRREGGKWKLLRDMFSTNVPAVKK
jgi:ketosteroid isomerase-like protein